MAVIIFLFSGCRVSFETGKYRISGRVTTIDGKEGIPGVTIEHNINGKIGYVQTDGGGYWGIWAPNGRRVKIVAYKGNDLFGPVYDFTVSKDVSGVDFKLIGFKDDFSDPGSKWDVKHDYDDGSYHDYAGDEYEIKVVNNDPKNPQSISTLSPSRVQVPHSYTVEVTTYPNGDFMESGTLGLVFNVRDIDTPDEFYYIFRVRPDAGLAEYVKVEKEQGKIVKVEEHQKTNKEINEDYATITPGVNLLKVMQNGSRASLFVNGVEVWENIQVEQQNCEFLRAGLYASADKNNTFTARFDDFKLYSIGYAPQPQFMGIQAHEIKSHKGIEIRK